MRALPNVTLIILEPFLLATGIVKPDWLPVLDQYRAAAARVAQAVGATFVPLHDRLTQLAKQKTPSYWSADGVHPTLAGHAELADAWRASTGL